MEKGLKVFYFFAADECIDESGQGCVEGVFGCGSIV